MMSGFNSAASSSRLPHSGPAYPYKRQADDEVSESEGDGQLPRKRTRGKKAFGKACVYCRRR